MSRVTMIIPVLALLLVGCDKSEADGGKTASTKTDAKAKAKAKADAKADAKTDAKADVKTDAKADPKATVQINLDEQGRALRGFDPLAYRNDGKPVEGKPEHTFEWNGAKWQFSSEENMAKFRESPEQWAPANGGYCTFGVVLSKKFDGDPNVWLLEDDGLYVFLNEEVKAKFLEDQAGNLGKVKANWPTIKDRAPAELDG